MMRYMTMKLVVEERALEEESVAVSECDDEGGWWTSELRKEDEMDSTPRLNRGRIP